MKFLINFGDFILFLIYLCTILKPSHSVYRNIKTSTIRGNKKSFKAIT